MRPANTISFNLLHNVSIIYETRSYYHALAYLSLHQRDELLLYFYVDYKLMDRSHGVRYIR